MSNTDKIRELNDEFRNTFEGGRVLVTPGIRGLGHYQEMAVLAAVQSFTAFTPDNDPWQEHDFGSFEMFGRVIFWKIDTYDADLTALSPDPSDPAVTTRVLTIMLAEEY